MRTSTAPTHARLADAVLTRTLIDLIDRLDAALAALPATTTGGRTIGSIAAAVELSERTSDLSGEVSIVYQQLAAAVGSPEGEWSTYTIGRNGVPAWLVAALEEISRIIAFPPDAPVESWNRWHAGDIVTADQLAALTSARSWLNSATLASTAPAPMTDGRRSLPRDMLAVGTRRYLALHVADAERIERHVTAGEPKEAKRIKRNVFNSDVIAAYLEAEYPKYKCPAVKVRDKDENEAWLEVRQAAEGLV